MWEVLGIVSPLSLNCEELDCRCLLAEGDGVVGNVEVEIGDDDTGGEEEGDAEMCSTILCRQLSLL
jgi:hypothetical protein